MIISSVNFFSGKILASLRLKNAEQVVHWTEGNFERPLLNFGRFRREPLTWRSRNFRWGRKRRKSWPRWPNARPRRRNPSMNRCPSPIVPARLRWITWVRSSRKFRLFRRSTRPRIIWKSRKSRRNAFFSANEFFKRCLFFFFSLMKTGLFYSRKSKIFTCLGLTTRNQFQIFCEHFLFLSYSNF